MWDLPGPCPGFLAGRLPDRSKRGLPLPAGLAPKALPLLPPEDFPPPGPTVFPWSDWEGLRNAGLSPDLWKETPPEGAALFRRRCSWAAGRAGSFR